MKVAAMLLADFAEVVNGKLYIIGGGWSISGPIPVPSAIAVKVEVPWSPADQKHNLRLELFDSNQRPVSVPVNGGPPQPVVVGGDFVAGHSPDIVEGTSLDVPFAINLPPLPLEPGKRYFWKLTIDGKTTDDWQVAFSMRAASHSVTAGK